VSHSLRHYCEGDDSVQDYDFWRRCYRDEPDWLVFLRRLRCNNLITYCATDFLSQMQRRCEGCLKLSTRLFRDTVRNLTSGSTATNDTLAKTLQRIGVVLTRKKGNCRREKATRSTADFLVRIDHVRSANYEEFLKTYDC
jgi:hypothetical protein